MYIQWWLRAFSFCFTSQQCCLCSQSSGQRELTLSGPRTEIPPPHPHCTPPPHFPPFFSLSLFSPSFSYTTCELVFVCEYVTKCACVSACAYTLSAWRGARYRQITSWRKHYSIAYSIQITQMFIATSATTGGEGWAFGRLAGLALHGAVVSDALSTASQEELTHFGVSLCVRI